jgi:hypothetical protein
LVLDVDIVVGEVSEDSEGSTGRVPAVPRAGHQVPACTKLQGNSLAGISIRLSVIQGCVHDVIVHIFFHQVLSTNQLTYKT